MFARHRNGSHTAALNRNKRNKIGSGISKQNQRRGRLLYSFLPTFVCWAMALSCASLLYSSVKNSNSLFNSSSAGGGIRTLQLKKISTTPSTTSAAVTSSSSSFSHGRIMTTSTATTVASSAAAVIPPPEATSTAVTTPVTAAMHRQNTDAGVDLTDPELYTQQQVNLMGDSSTATVMGMASGYELNVYERFVGSLRKSGFTGHIILGVAPDVSDEVLRYFEYRNVTPKLLQWVNCTYVDESKKGGDISELTTCAHPYPDIKIRWSRFPLARDWLSECETCTGPVLVMDVRDSFFQRDPFGPGSPVIKGLQVYQEHPSQTTEHWLTKWPIETCKGEMQYKETMLCSGTTSGTRVAMLKYLEIMYREMKEWIGDARCHFDINGDDQSIHNHLFYSGQLPFATSIPNRAGGIVNTVGVEGAILVKQHRERLMRDFNMSHGDAMWQPFQGASGKRWIGVEFNISDDEGFFTEADGSRSRVIHQWDRFGRPYVDLWLAHQDFVKDTIPSSFVDSAPVSSLQRRTRTDTGISVDDSELYTGVDLQGDSSTATVMGMASGYGLGVYQRFVGSLRKSGFKGHVILGVAPDVDNDVLRYFEHRNVTAKLLQWVNCTYRDESKKNDIFKQTTCAHPYPDIKIRWSRFPLARDWLSECNTCTGPVLVMDVRDSIFQRDPFGPGSPAIKGLQVYQEHPSQTTEHWLTKWPIEACKGVQFKETMLCSGTTTGTREAMLKYLEIMYREMKVWIGDSSCHFDINGDDQSIHNYLYYSRQLPFATSVPNRAGIVNTVGVEAARIWRKHLETMLERYNFTESKAVTMPFEGADGQRWIGAQYNLTDEEGFFTDADGSRSRVIHQWDRFGEPYQRLWLEKQIFVTDKPVLDSVNGGKVVSS